MCTYGVQAGGRQEVAHPGCGTSTPAGQVITVISATGHLPSMHMPAAHRPLSLPTSPPSSSLLYAPARPPPDASFPPGHIEQAGFVLVSSMFVPQGTSAYAL